MNKTNSLHIQVLVFALITSTVTAFVNLLIENTIGIDIFSFGIFLIIPIGAILIGAAGASGGLLACLYFNIMPSKIDAIVLTAIAAFTMFLIYYLGYSTLVLDDGVLASEVVDFGTYLDLVVTKSQLILGRGLRETGEVGSFGYWLLAFKFLGVLLGGVGVFCILIGLPVCADCDAYFRKVSVKENMQPNVESAQVVFDKIKSGSEEQYASAVDSSVNGDCHVKIHFTLMRCPKCRSELVTEEFFIKNKENNFVAIEKLKGKTLLPKNSIVTSFFPKQ
jgi:hypothetical protein